jgi:AcrR family transcriptional regulator
MAEEPEVRDQLVGGVREHVRANGVANLTVRALAAAAGRSTMCVYTRFEGRKGLLTAAYQHVAGELLAALDTADPARAYAAYAAAEPHLYSLLFEADFNALDLDAELRRNLLLAVIERFGPDGSGTWARLHGRICLNRLLQQVDEFAEAVAS